jgi:endoglucanase
VFAACAGAPLPSAAVASEKVSGGGAAPENPFANARLYVDPNSNARRQADAWRNSRPDDAALMDRMAEQPAVTWVGDWNRDVRRDADEAARRMRGAGALPVFVAYNIPQRDCGSYSAGGARNAEEYRRWVADLARGIGQGPAAVILEPDALAGMDCLDGRGQEERTALLRGAVDEFAARGISVYVDAGHARWHSPEEMARRLRMAGIGQATGFSLNVSNFHSNGVNITYGEALSQGVGGKGFIIDTSRNGIGTASPGDWCNPSGQALGSLPSTRPAHHLIHAFLWIKQPGESDGTCNGGPSAGQWWADYALGLAQRQTTQMAMATD